MTFINQHSFRCLLGRQSRNVQLYDRLFTWQVGKKNHFTTGSDLTLEDLPILTALEKSNFHYLSESNMLFLKQHFEVDRVKNRSVVLGIKDFSLVGGEMKSLRHAVNRCRSQNLELCSDYKKIDDVKKMIDEWSTLYTDSYFRDHSGKNLYFYQNNFHAQCINLFVYSGPDLVAFGTLSPCQDGKASYVIGKSLFKRFYGLSEYTDVMLYRKGIEAGIESVNMGQASKGLLFYKSKFPNSSELIHYDGNIKTK